MKTSLPRAWWHEIGAELRLPPAAMREDDKSSRHLQCHLGAMVLSEKVHGQVDSGRDPRRGEEAAVLDVQAIRLHPRVRKHRGQGCGFFPMRGDRLAWQ